MLTQSASLKKMIFFLGLPLLVVCGAADANASSRATEAREIRINHARELLGRHYTSSVVRTGERLTRVDDILEERVKASLPKKWKARAKSVAKVISEVSLEHGFDPFFVMAVIQNESSFNPDTKGDAGEIGLMQILPPTGKWMAELAGIRWRGPKMLNTPEDNIRIGTAYLSWLRYRFDSHARLYLAAFNMGQRNVDGALEKNIWPKDYAIRVMNRYVEYYERMKKSDKAIAGAQTLASRQ